MKTGNQVISVDLLPNRKVEISPMKKFMPVNHDEERNDSSVTIDWWPLPMKMFIPVNHEERKTATV